MEIPVHRMILEKGEAFDLEIISGERGLENKIKHSELHRPGLAFAGYVQVFTFDRIQIVGNTEISYLSSLEPKQLRERLESVFHYPIPCIIVTGSNAVPEDFIELSNLHGVPVLRTSHETTRFNAMISFWLEREFAETTTVHGVFVDVFGEGVLMTGGSGVGKSECALELIERGHRLVADDVVIVKRIGRNILLGSSSTHIQHHMEVRGLGIIDVELLFGIGAVREEKRISVMIELEKWSEGFDVDRLGIDEQKTMILDVPIRSFHIPVESGRNISILIEVAALQHRIFQRGINPAEELNKRLIKMMTGGR